MKRRSFLAALFAAPLAKICRTCQSAEIDSLEIAKDSARRGIQNAIGGDRIRMIDYGYLSDFDPVNIGQLNRMKELYLPVRNMEMLEWVKQAESPTWTPEELIERMNRQLPMFHVEHPESRIPLTPNRQPSK